MSREQITQWRRAVSAHRHIVVVGASVAGVVAAHTLRAEGYRDDLTIIGSEQERPYDRPPLSKELLAGHYQPEDVTLPLAVEANWMLGKTVTHLDAAARTVSLSDRTTVKYDGLVIATGLIPRRLPFDRHLEGIHVLRTIGDGIEFRDAMAGARRLIVIGAGFLGAEVAATARTLGLDVTLVDALDLPLVRQLGPQVARRLLELHVANGVKFVPNAIVKRLIDSKGRASAVELTDGTVLPTDMILLAIGSTPATGWLAGSGLNLTNGVDCDACCRAAPDIVAAGDVASWYHAGLARRVRLENRTNAAEQGRAAAHTLLGGAAEYAPVPYFWTDQFGVRIQMRGIITQGAKVTINNPAGSQDRFIAEFTYRGVLQAIIGWNSAKQFAQLQSRVAYACSASGV